MENIKLFIKNNTVFTVSAFLAGASCFLVIPSKEYISYIDFKTLSLLFCLMITVSGFRSINLFTALGTALSKKAHTLRKITVFMVLLCFFSSMAITNDVALLTFVPFTIVLFKRAGKEEYMGKVIILETISANLGSMLTPVGNPQNLYIYSVADMSLVDFIVTMAPLSTISLILILILCITIKDKEFSVYKESSENCTVSQKGTAVYTILFVLCLLCVLHILDYRLLLITVIVIMTFYNKKLFINVDYGLLSTFVFFFVFIGNLSNMSAVKFFLQNIILGREMIIGAISSQFISNVPAAVLLSKFTDNYRELLYGVNIGGLGTLIGSMASLISYKFYAVTEKADNRAYIKEFTLYNFGLLIVLMIFASIL